MVKPIETLEYWTQHVLPQVYDESLSFSELVGKVVVKLNDLIETSNVYFGQELTDVVDGIMVKWEADGKLGELVNDVLFQTKADKKDLTDFTTKMDTDFDTFKTQVSEDVENVQFNLNTAMEDFQSDLMTKAPKIAGTPEVYGAFGDGIKDDTLALQDCLNNNTVTELSPRTYRITKSLKLPRNHSINGNGARIIVKGGWTNNTFGASVPQNCMLWIEGREPIFESELDMKTSFIHDLRLQGDPAFNLLGIYMGTVNKTLISQPTSVNYSVAEYHFSNIAVSKLKDGIQLGEVWSSHFVNVTTSNLTGKGLIVRGQVVNVTFTGCSFATSNTGTKGIEIDGDIYYGGQKRRPEGLNFIGGLHGCASYGLDFITGLAVTFSNIILDLNTYGMTIEEGDFLTFTDCWINAMDADAVSFRDRVSNVNGSNVTFKGCKFVVGKADRNALYVGLRQNGIILDGCYIDNKIEFTGGNAGTVKDCIWVTPETAEYSIKIGANSNIVTTNNTFKASGSPVVVQRL